MALINCKECGKQMSDTAVNCPNCGAKNKNNNEGATTGLKVICFLIPLIGIIIFAINISSKPKYAKECLLASLLPTIILVIILLVVAVGGGIGVSLMTTAQTTVVSNNEMTEYEIATFNNQFKDYGGSNVSSTQVRTLISTVRTSNSINTDKQVKLSGEVTTIDNVKSSYRYSVEFKYNDKLITEIIINKK